MLERFEWIFRISNIPSPTIATQAVIKRRCKLFYEFWVNSNPTNLTQAGIFRRTKAPLKSFWNEKAQIFSGFPRKIFETFSILIR